MTLPVPQGLVQENKWSRGDEVHAVIMTLETTVSKHVKFTCATQRIYSIEYDGERKNIKERQWLLAEGLRIQDSSLRWRSIPETSGAC